MNVQNLGLFTPNFPNVFRDYVVSYDRKTRSAHWVFEHLTRDSVRRNDNVDRQRSAFKEDQSLHPYFRSTNEDFKVDTKQSRNLLG